MLRSATAAAAARLPALGAPQAALAVGASAALCGRGPASQVPGRPRGGRRTHAQRGLSTAADLQEAAAEALGRAAAAPPHAAHAGAAACRALLASHRALGAAGQVEWWAERAVSEEEAQLEALSRALPRGGRVAPGMLDAFVPAAPEPLEAAFRRLPGALGAAEGLAAALELRAAARRAAEEVGPYSAAGFALERLDRRLRDVLGLWFAPGLLRVDRVTDACPPEVLRAAAAVAEAAAPGCGPRGELARCFALRHAQMSPEAPPLLVAHASLLNGSSLPGTLAEAVAPAQADEAPHAACLWALGAPDAPGPGADAVRGLGLGQVLRRSASELLRGELSGGAGGGPGVVAALVPLQGFAAYLRTARPWERSEAVAPAQAEALRLAAQGAQGLGSGEGEVAFSDAEGDPVRFRLREEHSGGHALEVAFGGGQPRRVLKLVVAEGGQALRFLAEPGPEAFQIDVPGPAAGEAGGGAAAGVGRLAAAAGLLPAGLREPVLRLAYEFITQRAADGLRAAEPLSHFHLTGGAALNALHWRADESAAALADSLGVMASFVYRGDAAESEAAVAYAREGLNAATFTASP